MKLYENTQHGIKLSDLDCLKPHIKFFMQDLSQGG